jgi:DNA (cytosine-5)-methyltransferase 1
MRAVYRALGKDQVDVVDVGASDSATMAKEYTVISMFSGCGGMDLGFHGGFAFLGRRYERHPFKIVWANDYNEAACRTYRRNLGKIHSGDVWNLLDTLPSRADVLIGGFPCQDISVNGKGKGIDGARSGLYRAMVEAVRRTTPKIFVAENVKGLLMRNRADSLRRVIEDFGALGYNVSYHLYEAADYGVPQTRQRVFIIGTTPTLGRFVPPVRPLLGPEERVSAREAIGDLECLAEDESINHIWSRANKSPEQGNRRLAADRPGYTVRAECHGNIQYHYRLRRRISMREAARIQSFPDDFIFEAKLRETERQVGNAVPPVLAWHIAKAARERLP